MIAGRNSLSAGENEALAPGVASKPDVGINHSDVVVNGEVQIFLNFAKQGFPVFAILAIFSGEKEETKTCKP